ncbi:MAG: hypothetical protein KF799_14545, partial [Bdellovibrionales bacterium]|nr:hypothetical protein [Bdellovibrionales bacterium]
MQRLTILLSLLLIAAGCAGSSSTDGGTPVFVGKPRAFNGDWTGQGVAYTQNWKETGLTFTLHISKTPEGADIYYNIYEADGRLFSMGRLVDHYAIGNTLYSYRSKDPVGSIGTDGFTLDEADTAKFTARSANGKLELSGHLQYGGTEIQVEAV